MKRWQLNFYLVCLFGVIVGGLTMGTTRVDAFERGGPYHTQWGDVPAYTNQYEHEGRQAGWFEDAGKGIVTWFQKKAGWVTAQDVGDTLNFDHANHNGKRFADKADGKRENGNRIHLWARQGMNTIRTYLKAGLGPTRQDGFSVCRRKV